MPHILSVTTPFFALVLLGWVAARVRLVPLEALPGLNVFVLFFALPCLLFRFSAQTPIAQLFDGAVVAVFLGAGLAVVALAVGVARRLGRAWNDSAFGALVAAFPNSGFMGVPLIVALLGQAAAAPAIIALALDMVITTSLCIALSQLGPGHAGAAVGRALRGMLTNPLPWSMALGTVASATALMPPAPLMRMVELLAGSASPVALFTLGGVLARGQMRPASAGAATARQAGLDVGVIVVFKLLLHPLVVWGAGAAAIAAGLPLRPFDAAVLVLVAALPSASNVPILAERFQADAARIARVVMVSTVLAFVSFPLWVTLVKAPVAR